MNCDENKICCRICLTENFQGQSIFAEYKGEFLPTIVQDIAGLKIIEDEGLTETLCYECAEMLVKAQGIRRKCLQSDSALRAVIGEVLCSEGGSQHIFGIPSSKVAARLEDYGNTTLDGDDLESEFQLLVMKSVDDSENDEILFNAGDLEKPTTTSRFQCTKCSKVFSRESSFDRHLKYHTQHKSKCPICHREFAHKSNLKRHIATHKTNSPLSCEQCHESFDDSPTLFEHLQLHRKTTKDEEYIHECEVCGKQTTSLALHRAHLKHEHSIDSHKPFKCRICSMQFASKQGMYRHIDNIHENNRRNLRNRDKNFLCNTCGKKFYTNFHLQVHIRTHTGERPFKCDRCPKSFSQLSGLKMHKFTHTGERPFACRVCGKTFNQYGHVREHLLTHSDQRPHVCKICGHSFRVKGNLTAHMLVHTGTKPYVCKVCGKSYAQQTKLKVHLEKNHQSQAEEN